MSTRRVLRVCLRLLVRVMFDTYARFPQKFVITYVTKILVSFNQLGDGGATILCDALRESTVTKVQVQELDLRGNDIGPDGAKAVAAMAAVVASVTEVS